MGLRLGYHETWEVDDLKNIVFLVIFSWTGRVAVSRFFCKTTNRILKKRAGNQQGGTLLVIRVMTPGLY